MRISITLFTVLAVAGCGGGSGGGGAAATTTAPITTAPPVAQPQPSTIAPLVSAYEARRAAYLAHCATGGNYYAQIARLDLGLPFVRGDVDALCDFIDARPDTADFKVTALL